MARRADTRATVEVAERLGFDSLWVGDHIAFPMPILDPLLQLAQAAAFSERLWFGTSVYLLPLRHPTPVAKQVVTLDHLSEGRFVFGVGVGGEFPAEYAACGVPVRERGARLEEGIRLLKHFFQGQETATPGPLFPIPAVRMQPRPVQAGGPPIWCGGRSEPALRRAGRLADGWISYVVTPEAYARGLETIAAGAEAVDRDLGSFGTGHLLFTRIDNDHERALDIASDHLSRRYAMDFRRAAKRYAALGRPEDVAERIAEFWSAGLRHVVLDLVGPLDERNEQLERFSAEVKPLLTALA